MSKITAMYIRLSMEDEDVSLNQKEESNSVSSQRELLDSFIVIEHFHKIPLSQIMKSTQKIFIPANSY